MSIYSFLFAVPTTWDLHFARSNDGLNVFAFDVDFSMILAVLCNDCNLFSAMRRLVELRRSWPCRMVILKSLV